MNSSNHNKSIKLSTFTLTSAAVALAAVGAALPANANDYPFAIDTVLVGDINNPADNAPLVDGRHNKGSVSYQYRMGTYMVTQEQYVQFLNSVIQGGDLYDLGRNATQYTWMGNGIHYDSVLGYYVDPGYEKKPVAGVSFWDAARFCNWMTNMRMTGGTETETGMYDLQGTMSSDGSGILRNDNCWQNGGVALPTENEWYKAAYYDPTANTGSGDYWLYATTASRKAKDPFANDEMSTNYANYKGAYSNQPGRLVDVDFFKDYASHYGAVSMTGNLWEWTDATVSSSSRVRRGGGFWSGDDFDLQSAHPNNHTPDTSEYYMGFRVVSLEVIPEPSEFGLMAGAALGLLCLVRRKKRVRS